MREIINQGFGDAVGKIVHVCVAAGVDKRQHDEGGDYSSLTSHFTALDVQVQPRRGDGERGDAVCKRQAGDPPVFNFSTLRRVRRLQPAENVARALGSIAGIFLKQL